MAYLVDTNACIALINGSRAGSKKVLKSSRSGEEGGLPSVSVFELWYGVAKSMQTDANTRRVKMFLSWCGCWNLGRKTRGTREKSGAPRRMGRPIGTYDVLIAGQALNRKLTLVTANVKEFGG